MKFRNRFISSGFCLLITAAAQAGTVAPDLAATDPNATVQVIVQMAPSAGSGVCSELTPGPLIKPVLDTFQPFLISL
jgi:hypothetical protein